ncbi:MAG: zinc ribbon domain-containing protein [Chloroflexota bacterium]
MSASLGLYRLQLLDSRLDGIRTRLDGIRQQLENDEALLQARSQLEDSEAARGLAARALKQAEVEVEKVKNKIEQTEASLYSGSVKNPKELQDLQSESAALKRHLRTLEDRELEAMLAEEAATQHWLAATSHIETVQSQLSSQTQSLTREQADLEKELERLTSERNAALNPLDAGLLSSYDKLRQRHKGLAVACLNEGACAACGTTLTPAQQQSARSTTQLYYCPTCGRILYTN